MKDSLFANNTQVNTDIIDAKKYYNNHKPVDYAIGVNTYYMETKISELLSALYEHEKSFTKFTKKLWTKWPTLQYCKWHNQLDLDFLNTDFINKINDLDEKYKTSISEIESDEDISEEYKRFIIMEIGQQSLDPYGQLANHTDFAIDSLYSYLIIGGLNQQLWSNEIDQHIWNVENFLGNLNTYYQFFSAKLSALKIFSNISQVTGNTVIIGANGSGKSTFARQLKRLHSENISIISAQHLLFYSKNENMQINENPLEKIRDFQKNDKLPNQKDGNIYEAKQEIVDDFDNLINALTMDFYAKANKYYLNDEKEQSELVQAINIWNSIIEHRELFVDSYWIKVRDKDSKEIYEFNQLSDGEKAIFYYIAHILISKDGNYIIVDEPENHLNLAVCNLLWDKLEEVKKNSTFVYLTHNVDFAVSRINTTLLWNKSFTVPDSWDIQGIPSNTEIPDELLVEIAGSRKNVLFCEGEKSSLDYKLYTILFEDQYTIIPVSGHLDVVNYCGAYNRANLFQGKAIGLIDGDYHEEEQINSWKKKGVHALPYSEIENMFCSQLVLDDLVNKALITLNQVDNFKSNVFKDMRENADSMAVIFVRDKLNNRIKNNLLKSKKNFQGLSDELEDLLDSTSAASEYENIKREYIEISEEKDYENYLKRSNVKGKMFSFANSNFELKKFEEKVLLQLRNDNELKQKYIKEYFKDIVE